MCACVRVCKHAHAKQSIYIYIYIYIYISELITLNKCLITVLREILDSQKNKLN